VENQKTLKQKGVITENLDLSEFGIQERLISVTLMPCLALEVFANAPVCHIQISCENGVGDLVTLSDGLRDNGDHINPIQFFVKDLSSFKIVVTSFDENWKVLKTEQSALDKVSDRIVHVLDDSVSTGPQSITLKVNRSYLYVALTGFESDTVDLDSHWNLFDKLCQIYNEKADDFQKAIGEVTESESAVSKLDSHMLKQVSEIMKQTAS